MTPAELSADWSILKVCLAVVLAVAGLTSDSIAAEKLSPEQPVSFVNDIVPIFTKLRCNSGGCHGKATGQNGFKLSLLGFEPDYDFQSLTKEARGRRVVRGNPDQSLLIAKAIGKVPHGGGKRLDDDSEDFRILASWIRTGASGPNPNDPKLERIEVSPKRQVLSLKTMQPLKVVAHFSNGRQLDVTQRAVYESNVSEIADVDDDGAVSTFKRGQFAIMVRFGNQIDVFHGVVPFHTESTATSTVVAGATKVDQHLVQQWKRLGITPSKLTDDASWLRRVSLDVCGTLPTSSEVRRFVADERKDKRTRWVNELLERSEYASYFALKWADILQNRGRGYSTRRQRAGTSFFSTWIRDSIADNKPYDQFVAEILTATGGQNENPPTIWYRSIRSQQDYVESISQGFLGVRLQCAQCHHHPAERWSQADYYGLAAVFSRVGRKRGYADAEVPTNEVIFLKDKGEVLHPRTRQVMNPRPLGGPDFEVSKYEDPRHAFARWLTTKQNPFFARTMVNRMWGHFMGRGIIHPIDDARSTNPPSNPELLDQLAVDFAENRFDVKQLIRDITSSRAYQLSVIPTNANKDDVQNFARFYARRMPAEVLLDAISQILEAPTIFPGGPGTFPVGTRAIDLPDENVNSNFLDVFGRPARTSACECERIDAPSLAQALQLVSSQEVQEKLTAKNGFIEKISTSKMQPAEVIDEMFLRTFSRKPKKAELETALDFVQSEEDKAEAYRSLMWSLLATNEFLFNH